MLTSSIIDFERNYNSTLYVIISLGTIPGFYFVTIILYMWKVIIANNTMSDWGGSINGSHKWSANYDLHDFFGWTVTNNFLVFW